MSMHSQVLSLIRSHVSISQSEIRTGTGLSASAVSNSVKRAISLGLVKEVGQLQEDMGRPRTLLSLDPDYGYAVGVQLNSTHNRIVLANLKGEVVLSEELQLSSTKPIAVAEAIAEFAGRASSRNIVGIGIGLSGIVDAEAGICLYSTTLLGWRNVPIARLVTNQTGLPTAVENDANALALAELWFGDIKPRDSFVMVTLGSGIGAGIIIDQRTYRGRNGLAGEIGHTRVTSEPGYPCHCGKNGCLEAVVSTESLTRRVSGVTGQPVSADQLRGAVKAGGAACEDIIQHAGTLLGTTLATLAMTFDSDAVYLAFDSYLDLPHLGSAIQEGFEANLLPVSHTRTELRTLKDSGTMWARGASSIAIERFFDTTALELASLTLSPWRAAEPGPNTVVKS